MILEVLELIEKLSILMGYHFYIKYIILITMNYDMALVMLLDLIMPKRLTKLRLRMLKLILLQ